LKTKIRAGVIPSLFFNRRYKMQDIKSREKLEKVIEKIKELEKELNAELEARKKQREYYECRMERVNRGF
jgi:predicted RNase H-like nuclease (RuvC/YqgF family)